MSETIRSPDLFTLATLGTIVGAVSVLCMLVASFIFDPRASEIDRPRATAEFISTVEAVSSEILVFIALDSLFLVGYSFLFIGLYLIIRDLTGPIGKIALIVGLMVGFLDIIENALIFTLVHGIVAGWIPEPEMVGQLFMLNMFIDLLSYVAALLFALIFLTLFKPGNNKFVLGLLLLIYVVIGVGSLISPPLLLVRSFFFVIGLFYGVYVLSKEEEIPSEMLLQLINQEEQSKDDFIR